jgi:hypothetical protein
VPSRRLARAHRGGRDWGGPHGGERNKMQRGHGVKRRKRKEEEKKIREEERKEKRKESERKNGENNLSIFLEIVIHNLYLLYYYRVMKIEDVSYKYI